MACISRVCSFTIKPQQGLKAYNYKLIALLKKIVINNQ